MPASHVSADQAPAVVTSEIRQTRTDLHGRADLEYPQIRGLADQIQKVGNPKWIESGTTPVAEKFTGWVFASDGIEITFGQYQVAAYAEGMPRILVLNHAMRDLLGEGGQR
jgi:hypothetical protein